MSSDKTRGWLGGRRGLRAKRRDRAVGRFFALESLDQRIVPAITAKYSPVSGVLTIMGDLKNNQITVSRNTAGRITINNGNVKIVGGRANVAKTRLIQVLGKQGNDT